MYLLVFAGLGFVIGLSCRVHLFVAINAVIVLTVLVAIATGNATWWALANVAIMQFGYVVGGLLRTPGSRPTAVRVGSRVAGR